MSTNQTPVPTINGVHDDRYKSFQKKALQLMRPYEFGEDMTGIEVSDEDKKLPTLEGGFIAVNADNPMDMWYIGKKFHENNYVSVTPITQSTFLSRLQSERTELNSKLEKLVAYQKSEAFEKLDSVNQSFLDIQAHAMATYDTILAARIEWLDIKKQD